MTSNFAELQKQLYIHKNYELVVSKILNSENISIAKFQKLLASALFAMNQFDACIDIYKNLNDFYKVGYCCLLKNELIQATAFFNKAENSPAKNWALFFCDILAESKLYHIPSYFQIRSFLERDLNIFLKLQLDEYVQALLNVSEYLFEINPESNKFFAKPFLYNNYTDFALEFLERALDYTDEDGEIFYLLGLYNIQTNNINDAKICLERTLKLNKNYPPASILLAKLDNKNIE